MLHTFYNFILFCVFLQTSVSRTQSRHSQELIILKMDKCLFFDQSLLTFYSFQHFSLSLSLSLVSKKKKQKTKKEPRNRACQNEPGDDKLANFHARGRPRQTEPALSCDLLIIWELISRSRDPDERSGEREQKKKGSGIWNREGLDTAVWRSVVKKPRRRGRRLLPAERTC